MMQGKAIGEGGLTGKTEKKENVPSEGGQLITLVRKSESRVNQERYNHVNSQRERRFSHCSKKGERDGVYARTSNH